MPDPLDDTILTAPPHPLRRAVPRQPAEWFGFYHFDDADDEPTRCCRVLDVSPLGFGLELFATGPDERLSGLITVSVELRGQARNVVRDDVGHTARVGVEFPHLSDETRKYLRRLNGIQSRW